MNQSFHTTEISVRDYECDLEGIVNNAVYLNYLEHARHEFLKESGVSFSELHHRGLDPVVVRIEVDYLGSLVPGDVIEVHTRMSRKGMFRFIFNQQIVRTRDAVETTRAMVIGTFIQDGRPVSPPEELEQLFDPAVAGNRFGA